MNKRIYIAAAAVVVLLLSIVVILLGVDWNKTVGICYMEKTDESNAAYREALEQTLKQQGMEVLVTVAESDHSKQLSLIQELIDRRCDALIIEPVMLEDGTELLEELSRTKLPTVLIGRSLDDALVESYPFITFVGTDDTQPGKLQAQMVMDLPDGGDVNGDGIISYMIIQGPEEDQLATLRTATFRQTLATSVNESEMLTIGYGDWSADSGLQICRQEMASFGKDIEVIVCGSDRMALGAAQAIEEGGWQLGQDVYLFGIGADEQVLQLIREGKITGTVSSDINLQINAVLTTLINQLGGQSMSNQSSIRQLTVTADNVESFLNEN